MEDIGRRGYENQLNAQPYAYTRRRSGAIYRDQWLQAKAFSRSACEQELFSKRVDLAHVCLQYDWFMAPQMSL
jgi:hypothetical protein